MSHTFDCGCRLNHEGAQVFTCARHRTPEEMEETVPLVHTGDVPAGATVLVSLLALPRGKAYRIVRAEPVKGINYSVFSSKMMFLGATCSSAPFAPWPLAAMLSKFLWPRGGAREGYVGQIDFNLQVTNNSDSPQPFAINLVLQPAGAQ